MTDDAPAAKVEPAEVDPLAGLAARVDALTKRVAYLEARTGFADDVTIGDLPDEAAAMLGTNPTDLTYYSPAAKAARAEARKKAGQA